MYIATSVDGFIARSNGAIDWLMAFPPPSPGEDYGYSEFMDETDTLVIGRKTYELAITFAEWPYPEKKVLVLSTRNLELPERLRSEVSTTSESPREIKARLEKAGSRSVYVDGGRTIQSFIRVGLIDEITVTRVPTLLGEGIPLFGKTDVDVKLEHTRTRWYANGFVQSTYRLSGAAENLRPTGKEGRLE